MADHQTADRNKYIVPPPSMSLLAPPPYPGLPETTAPASLPTVLPTPIPASTGAQPTSGPVAPEENHHPRTRQASTLPPQNSNNANAHARPTTPPGHHHHHHHQALSLLHRATSVPAEADGNAAPSAGNDVPAAPTASARPTLPPLVIAGQHPSATADPSIPPPPASPSPPPYPCRPSQRNAYAGGVVRRADNYANYTGGPQVFYGNESPTRRATVVVTQQPGTRRPPPEPKIVPSPTIAIFLGACATACCLWIFGIPALVLGVLASQPGMRQAARRSRARFYSIAGIILGSIGILGACAAVAGMHVPRSCGRAGAHFDAEQFNVRAISKYSSIGLNSLHDMTL